MEEPLELDATARSVIYEHSLAAYPREACGLLLGSNRRAMRAVSCRNMAAEPDRFELHPEDFLAAELEAETVNLEVVGVWHSHPDQPAVPSERDRENAYPAWIHVICRVDATEDTSLRAWHLDQGRFVEQLIMP